MSENYAEESERAWTEERRGMEREQHRAYIRERLEIVADRIETKQWRKTADSHNTVVRLVIIAQTLIMLAALTKYWVTP